MWPFRFAMHRKRGLRMMVVSVLASSPKNGVEIMDGIETLTRGWWRPTPGSIYPLLQKMVDEETIRKLSDDSGRYELTPKAKNELDASFGPRFRSPHSAGSAVSEIKGFVSFLEDLQKSGDKEIHALKADIRDAANRLASLTEPEADDSE